jgi:sugar/nucleoside kinase (ribokinase family)
MPPRLVCLGNMSFDDVVLPDGTERPGCLGGDALYAALGARLVMPEVELVAPVGTDFPPAVMDRIAAAGLSVAGMPPRARTTLHNRVAYDADGGRTWTIYDDEPAFDDLSPTFDDIPVPFRAAEAFLVLAMTLSAQIRLVENMRRHTGALVALDTQEDYIVGNEPAVRALIAQTDVFLPSAVEIRQLLGHEDWDVALPALASLGPSIVVAKRGGDGCTVYEAASGRMTHVPALPATVVDTTGAGDSFCGAFVAALLESGDAVAAAHAGVAAASFTVEDYGLDQLWLATLARFRRRLHHAQ